MAQREIATTIKLDGEKAFRSALSDAQRELRVMATDLKAAAAEFEFTGDKQQLFTAKSRTLRDEIEQQDKIVGMLSQAVKDSAEKYGDASKQTDGYRIKLSNATATLFKLKQQLAETDREAEELGRDSVRVGRQIKDGIGDAAEETSESLDDMIKKLSSDIGDIKGSTSFTALSAGVNFVTGSIGKINDFVESTRDYRNKRALAQSAVEEALNISEEEYNNLFLRIVGVTNDADGANEGIVTLMKSGIKTYEEALTLTDMFLGLYTQFGEEAKFEDLAESWQETYATGKMTGKIQELAERQGIDPEIVNKAMEGAPQEERVQILANAFAGTGGMQSLQNYRETNASLVRENEAKAELNNALADLADEASPITTSVTEKGIGVVKTADAVLKMARGDEEEAKKTLGITDEAMKKAVQEIQEQDNERRKQDQEFANKVKENDFATGASAAWEALKGDTSDLKDIYGDSKLGNFYADFLSGVGASFDPKRRNQLWSAALSGEKGSPEEKGKTDGEAYTDAVKQTITDEIPTMQEITSAFLSGGDEAVQSLIDSRVMSDEDKEELITMLKELGMLSGAGFDEELNAQMVAAANNASIAGANLGTAIKNGLDSTMPLAVESLQSYVGQMRAAYESLGAGLNTTVAYPRVPGQVVNGGTGAATASNAPIILEMNGRELGRGILPTINTLQGRNVTRTTVI